MSWRHIMFSVTSPGGVGPLEMDKIVEPEPIRVYRGAGCRLPISHRARFDRPYS